MSGTELASESLSLTSTSNDVTQIFPLVLRNLICGSSCLVLKRKVYSIQVRVIYIYRVVCRVCMYMREFCYCIRIPQFKVCRCFHAYVVFFMLLDKGMSRIYARLRQWGNIKEFHVNWCANIIRTWVKGKRIGRMFIRLSLTFQINFTNLVRRCIQITTNIYIICYVLLLR